MVALSIRDLVRWVVGLFVYDLIRLVWRAEQPEPRRYETRCAWCGACYSSTAMPATPTTPPPDWYRCDPERGIGEHVWWCSLRCVAEHGAYDVRAATEDAVGGEPDAGD